MGFLDNVVWASKRHTTTQGSRVTTNIAHSQPELRCTVYIINHLQVRHHIFDKIYDELPE